MGFQIVELDGVTQAPGSAAPTRGVQVLGQDGTNSRVLLVDASGRPLVTIATALPAGSNLVGKVQLRNPGDSADLGDGTNPIRTDPTGSTTQPVSAASLPLPTGASTLAEQQIQTTALQLVDDVVHAANAALNKAVAIGGQMDDTSITDATENNVSPVRITAKRALHVAPHDALGNAITSLLDGIARRLQVEASIAPGQSVSIGTPIPEDPTNIVRDFVENSGSPNMLVNGSVTPVDFDFLKDATDDIKVGELRFVMVADSILIQGDKFGPVNALANGLRIQVTSNDSTTDLANLTLSEDFLTFPNPQLFFDRGGPKEVMAVSFSLGGAVKLFAASTADKIRVTVRDNLTDVKFKYFRCTVSGVKV